MKTMTKNDSSVIEGELVRADQLPALHHIRVSIDPFYRHSPALNRVVMTMAWLSLALFLFVLVNTLTHDPAAEQRQFQQQMQAQQAQQRYELELAQISANRDIQIARASSAAWSAALLGLESLFFALAVVVGCIIAVLAIVAIAS